jgi:hypothetical protein
MRYMLTFDTDDDCGVSHSTAKDVAYLSICIEGHSEESIRSRLMRILEDMEVVLRYNHDSGRRYRDEMIWTLAELKRANEKNLTEFHYGGNREVIFKEIREPQYDFTYRERG